MPPIEIDAEALGLSAEQLAAINSAHEAGVSEKITGLQNKNSELLGKLKKTKEEGGEVGAELESLRQFRQQAEQNQEAAKGNYEEALKLAQTNYAKELEKLQQEKQSLAGNLEKILIDNGLASGLDAVKVKPEFKEAVTALLRGQVALKEGAALVGDKPLAEYLTEWAQTDQGKAFVSASNNSGGGANGGASNPSTKNPWARETRNLTEQAKILQSDPQLAAQLKAAAGRA